MIDRHGVEFRKELRKHAKDSQTENVKMDFESRQHWVRPAFTEYRQLPFDQYDLARGKEKPSSNPLGSVQYYINRGSKN